eukprot:2481542-Rhodomonas_salina.3
MCPAPNGHSLKWFPHLVRASDAIFLLWWQENTVLAQNCAAYERHGMPWVVVERCKGCRQNTSFSGDWVHWVR